MKFFKCALQIFLICVILTEVVLSVGEEYGTLDGLRYFIEDEYKYNWFEASHYCARLDMQLAVLDTEEKNIYLIRRLEKTFGTSLNLWIGGSDNNNELMDKNRPFYWKATGKRFSYTHWSPENPDNSNYKEHCVHIWDGSPHFEWNDSDCKKKFGFICEQKTHYYECKRILHEIDESVRNAVQKQIV